MLLRRDSGASVERSSPKVVQAFQRIAGSAMWNTIRRYHNLSHSQGFPNFVLPEAHDDPTSNNDSWESAPLSQSLYLLDGLFPVLFRQQVHISEFVFDSAFSEKALAGFAVTTCTKGVKLALLHRDLLPARGDAGFVFEMNYVITIVGERKEGRLKTVGTGGIRKMKAQRKGEFSGLPTGYTLMEGGTNGVYVDGAISVPGGERRKKGVIPVR